MTQTLREGESRGGRLSQPQSLSPTSTAMDRLGFAPIARTTSATFKLPFGKIPCGLIVLPDPSFSLSLKRETYHHALKHRETHHRTYYQQQ